MWAGNVCRDDCAALDVTHPAAAAYLAGVLATMRGWDIDYFKIDFCYAGAYEGLRQSGDDKSHPDFHDAHADSLPASS